MVEALDGAVEGARRGERADVQLVEHRAGRGKPLHPSSVHVKLQGRRRPRDRRYRRAGGGSAGRARRRRRGRGGTRPVRRGRPRARRQPSAAGARAGPACRRRAHLDPRRPAAPRPRARGGHSIAPARGRAAPPGGRRGGTSSRPLPAPLDHLRSGEHVDAIGRPASAEPRLAAADRDALEAAAGKGGPPCDRLGPARTPAAWWAAGSLGPMGTSARRRRGSTRRSARRTPARAEPRVAGVGARGRHPAGGPAASTGRRSRRGRVDRSAVVGVDQASVPQPRCPGRRRARRAASSWSSSWASGGGPAGVGDRSARGATCRPTSGSSTRRRSTSTAHGLDVPRRVGPRRRPLRLAQRLLDGGHGRAAGSGCAPTSVWNTSQSGWGRGPSARRRRSARPTAAPPPPTRSGTSVRRAAGPARRLTASCRGWKLVAIAASQRWAGAAASCNWSMSTPKRAGSAPTSHRWGEREQR